MSDNEILGKCPECGGDVVESKKAYGCSNWREPMADAASQSGKQSQRKQ
ncbi:MAG: hypothetical protein GXP60_03905 [Epsilonproteobacteria bacterium]|nr:hypothetical protein [Campylobacterota bacterium]